MVSNDLFVREPLGSENGIPVFSARNAYTDNYAQISADHLQTMNEDGSNPFIAEDVWKQAEQSTVELVRKYAPAGSSILDVGVGLARLLSNFPELRRFGMDISLPYLDIARSKGIEVVYSLVEDIPFRPESFDTVVCTDVLEHVLDLNLAASKILSVLKPGGTLIVRVPYREDLSYYASPECPYQYVHLRTFDEASLKLFFERIMGVEVLEATMAAYAPYGNRLRLPLPFPKRDAFLRRALGVVKRVNPSSYRRWMERLYMPIEINIVVRKGSR